MWRAVACGACGGVRWRGGQPLAARETHSVREYFEEQLKRLQVDVPTRTRVVGAERGHVRAITLH